MDPSTITTGILALAVIIFVGNIRRLEKRLSDLEAHVGTLPCLVALQEEVDRNREVEVEVEQSLALKATCGAMIERADGSVDRV